MQHERRNTEKAKNNGCSKMPKLQNTRDYTAMRLYCIRIRQEFLSLLVYGLKMFWNKDET